MKDRIYYGFWPELGSLSVRDFWGILWTLTLAAHVRRWHLLELSLDVIAYCLGALSVCYCFLKFYL